MWRFTVTEGYGKIPHFRRQLRSPITKTTLRISMDPRYKPQKNDSKAFAKGENDDHAGRKNTDERAIAHEVGKGYVHTNNERWTQQCDCRDFLSKLESPFALLLPHYLLFLVCHKVVFWSSPVSHLC